MSDDLKSGTLFAFPEEEPPAPHRHATGAVRSEVKPYYSAIPHHSLLRLAMRATGAPRGEMATLRIDEHEFHYSGGSRGYGYGNWAQGLPLQDTFNHIIDHLYHWKDCVENGHLPLDDDLAAAAWGIMMPLMKFEQEYVKGHLILGPDPEVKK